MILPIKPNAESCSSIEARNMSGWRLFGLYAYCLLLTALAAALSAAFATAPHWIWPAQMSGGP